MQRLIDAGEALELIDNYKKSISMTAKTEVAVSAIEDIVRFICPTIDAEPVVRCDNCKCSIVNGGDCDSVLVNIRRNHITETNEFIHLHLEYCSNGIKMDEKAKK